MRQASTTPWGWILLGAAAVVLVSMLGLATGAAMAGDSPVGPHIGLIELSGVISEESAAGLLGSGKSGPRRFMEEVAAATDDASTKAVVIRINSPGGSAAASQEMYQAVRRLAASKPVVCSMGDVAASGGYYVASACNKIYANGSTLTGSIGVISEFLNYQGLAQKLGLDQSVIKSGLFKDAGNPARPLTAQEKQLFQALVMNVYGQFVDDVAIGRGKATNGRLTRAAILRLADGRVYTGQQAKANLLIDEVGGLYDAEQYAGKAGGISGRPAVKEYGAGSLLGSLVSARADGSVGEAVGAGFAVAGRAFGAGLIEKLGEANAGASAPQAR